MPILKMDPDAIFEQSRSILQSSTEILNHVNRLRYSANNLNWAWEGGGSASLTNDLLSAVNSLEENVHKLDSLSENLHKEGQEWLEADHVQSSFLDIFWKSGFSIDDLNTGVGKGSAAVYLITHLKWTPKRPNSMVFKGPNWMRRAVGIKEGTRVIRPSVLVKQMTILALAANLAEAGKTAFDTYTNPEYIGTDRAVPAALADGLVKFGILAGGTLVLTGLTAAIASFGLPVLVAGGLVIGTWVVGGFLLDKFAQTPLWKTWQQSHARDELIENGTRIINSSKAYLTEKVNTVKLQVKNAFAPFINNLLQAGASG